MATYFLFCVAVRKSRIVISVVAVIAAIVWDISPYLNATVETVPALHHLHVPPGRLPASFERRNSRLGKKSRNHVRSVICN
jgi:hypothetical protein